MELRQLRTFSAIARLGSFAQAADALGYAQSSVTTHIQTLEAEMKVKLFERLAHRVELTQPGRALLPYAEQILKLAAEALVITVNPSLPQGTLTLGTNESLGTYRLPKLLEIYRKEYPQVELALKFNNCEKICEDLRQNKIDAALIINNKTWENDIVSVNISQENMVFIAAPNHPLAPLPAVNPKDLARTCVILTEPGCSYRQTLEQFLKNERTTPQSTLEASSVETIKQLVMLGLGISLLPQFAVEKELSDGKLFALPWKKPISDFHVQLLYHRDKWLSPTLQSFFQTVHRYSTL